MQPHERIHYLFYNLLRRLFKLVGHDIFRGGEFKPYLFTYVMYALISLFSIGAVNTVLKYDLVVIINLIATSGFAFELMIKMCSVNYAEMLLELMDKIVEVYAANANNTSPKRRFLLKMFSTLSEIVLKVGCVAYYFSGAFHFINPIYAYFWRNEIEPLLPVYIPFIDDKSFIGLSILSVLHLMLLTAGITGTSACDFMFVLIILNVPVLSTIFSDNIHELNTILREKEINIPLMKAKLRNILLIHREIFDFVDALDSSFFQICFVQIFCAAITAALQLFVCLKIEFFPAIGLVVSALVQIVAFCAVGTVIELCNDQIYDNITRVDWFLLSDSDQKVYKFLMFHAQEARTLTIGGIIPLNMDTCVSVLRSIYSYVMILYQMVE